MRSTADAYRQNYYFYRDIFKRGTIQMAGSNLRVRPALIPEWEAERLLNATLREPLERLDDEQAQLLLDELVFQLPSVMVWHELVPKPGTTPLGPLVPDFDRYAYYLTELPLSILVPEGKGRLRRLRLRVELSPGTKTGSVETATGGSPSVEPPVATDIFPTRELEEQTTDLGTLSVDLAKGLLFVFGPAAEPASELLDLKITVPLKWMTREVTVRGTGRNNSEVNWEVKEAKLEEGFTSCMILRTPRGTPIGIRATMVGELVGPSWYLTFETDRTGLADQYSVG